MAAASNEFRFEKSTDDHDYHCQSYPKQKKKEHELKEPEDIQPVSKNWDLDDIGEFFFESDHLALKGNRDYHALLKTIVVLEAQRAQAIRDLDRLYECQEEALVDPIGFVEKLQRNEDVNIPRPQHIASIPVIDWSRYMLSHSSMPFKKQKMTRLATKEISSTELQSLGKGLNINTDDSGAVIVRGRVYNKTKPSTFNQLWTKEEQRRLEELLLQYPPEEVESRRWQKIAAALGNRTPTQVASRVQKYFLKLSKAGLPIPGRQPNPNAVRKLSSRRSRYSWYTSTFLVSHAPPVFMSDFDDDNSNSCPYSASSSIDGDAFNAERGTDPTSDDEGIPLEVKDTPEYQELVMLQKLREQKLTSQGLAQHVGYQCDRCGCQPIIGTRWHCSSCPPDVSVDFCSDCVDCMHESGHHTADHELEAIHQAQDSTFVDRDYMHFMGGDYNYLDPNYMPAT